MMLAAGSSCNGSRLARTPDYFLSHMIAVFINIEANNPTQPTVRNTKHISIWLAPHIGAALSHCQFGDLIPANKRFLVIAQR